MAPVILSNADRASAKALEVALDTADSLGIALCLTMTPGDNTDKLTGGLLAGSPVIRMPDPEMETIAAGLLASEGLKEAESLAAPLAKFLKTCESECSKQPHYDFGTRTLHQLCTQTGAEIRERAGGQEEKKVLVTVFERCIMPKLTSEDMAKVQALITDIFKITPTPIPAVTAENRWPNVVKNIATITMVEPDCMVLPVQEADESEFFKSFSRSLNAEGAVMARMKGKLSDYTPEELLGTMPRAGEEVKEGVLVELLRRAMDDNEDSKRVWIVVMAGSVTAAIWESLYELLNDTGCINLATGEQLRLKPNLRYLFVMPAAGGTTQDTFSRSAIVYTNPP